MPTDTEDDFSASLVPLSGEDDFSKDFVPLSSSEPQGDFTAPTAQYKPDEYGRLYMQGVERGSPMTDPAEVGNRDFSQNVFGSIKSGIGDIVSGNAGNRFETAAENSPFLSDALLKSANAAKWLAEGASELPYAPVRLPIQINNALGGNIKVPSFHEPLVTPEMAKATMDFFTRGEEPTQVGQGVKEFVTEQIPSLTSPAMLATFGSGKLLKSAGASAELIANSGRALGAGFGMDIGSHIPESIANLADTIRSGGSTKDKTKASLEAGIGPLLLYGIGKHANTLPEASKAAAEVFRNMEPEKRQISLPEPSIPKTRGTPVSAPVSTPEAPFVAEGRGRGATPPASTPETPFVTEAPPTEPLAPERRQRR